MGSDNESADDGRHIRRTPSHPYFTRSSRRSVQEREAGLSTNQAQPVDDHREQDPDATRGRVTQEPNEATPAAPRGDGIPPTEERTPEQERRVSPNRLGAVETATTNRMGQSARAEATPEVQMILANVQAQPAQMVVRAVSDVQA